MDEETVVAIELLSDSDILEEAGNDTLVDIVEELLKDETTDALGVTDNPVVGDTVDVTDFDKEID